MAKPRGRPFKPGEGGRPKGVLNKENAARQAVSEQLLEAWHEGNGPAKARKILKAAIDAAEDGDLSELNVILPYIARKQPERAELVNLTANMTPEELRAAAKRYLDNTSE